MVWLQGLANIQLGRVVEFLEPIASGNNAESRHFRVLAAWASLPTALLRPDVVSNEAVFILQQALDVMLEFSFQIYPVYWPILVNRTEHLEIRIAALTLLLVSSPTSSRLISLYWYMQSEPSQHLYNYFYTTLKSLERTTYPCYLHMYVYIYNLNYEIFRNCTPIFVKYIYNCRGAIAAQFTRVLRPPRNQYLITGSYVFDYQDIHRKFGALIQGTVIANPLTNIPEVLHVTLNTYGAGNNINRVSVSLDL